MTYVLTLANNLAGTWMDPFALHDSAPWRARYLGTVRATSPSRS